MKSCNKYHIQYIQNVLEILNRTMSCSNLTKLRKKTRANKQINRFGHHIQPLVTKIILTSQMCFFSGRLRASQPGISKARILVTHTKRYLHFLVLLIISSTVLRPQKRHLMAAGEPQSLMTVFSFGREESAEPTRMLLWRWSRGRRR